MGLKYTVKRTLIQLMAVGAQNPFVQDFFTGTIYKGPLKNVCAPGLNCYSCPAAAGACPIGSLQSIANSAQYSVSFYVVGFLLIVGALIGRLVCGFLCLFGFLQDLLFKIPTPKLRVPPTLDRWLRKLKYVVLVVFVIALPMFVMNQFGLGEPWFCEYLCPAGTFEAGIPLLATNESLRAMIGPLFNWKLWTGIIILVAAVFISRPFCRYLCPLGAIYGLFNRISFFRMSFLPSSCIQCGKCRKVCLMGIDPTRELQTAECIRCGMCKNVCPTAAISWDAKAGAFVLHPNETKET